MPAKKTKVKSKKSKKVNYKIYFIHYSYCLIIIVLLLVAGFNINNFLNDQKVLGASVDVTPLQNEKNYWENLIHQNPSYVDGYLQIAKVDVEMSNKKEAYLYIQKALELDPNSTKIPEVIKALSL
ncbi:MAG TPA: hypothetical protein VG895_04480 [Patescibacteria group bacterium]|nr:hypothetical protein [Patescibacteria group bacterium]